MRVCVVGLWHLGCVTAACLASKGHSVVGLEFDDAVVSRLKDGIPPIFEPGLAEMVQRGLQEGVLSFSSDAAVALRNAEVVWITYDTPVDQDDRADVAFVTGRIRSLFPGLRDGTLVLISSQLPAGTTRELERAFAADCPGKSASFAYSPENLRLGRAISVFLEPDRVVVGVRNDADLDRVAELLSPITDRVEWMGVEAAEMTKHGINAFLAMSVSFANELASLCERVGADAKEVERGLKSESRIGHRAYISPGAAFAGGTLARDVAFLSQLGSDAGVPTTLISAVRTSNEEHKRWPHRRLSALLGDLRGRRVAVWGLTYKPGTDTLRRSSSVELCRWLASQGAEVRVHDPAVNHLPPDLEAILILCGNAVEAVEGAEALVVSTPWPDYRQIDPEAVSRSMARRLILDAAGHLAGVFGSHPRVEYVTVGRPRR